MTGGVCKGASGKGNSYMSYAGYAAAKATVEAKESDFYHNLALNAQKTMKENALITMKVFSNIN